MHALRKPRRGLLNRTKDADRADAVVSLALLLLAASERGLELLIKPNEGTANDRAIESTPSQSTGVSS